MIEASRKKQINCLNIWLQNTRLKNREYEQEIKIKEIRTRFLNRLLMTKTGGILEAFKKWKSIPNRKNMEKYNKLTRFERGLNEYFASTMKRSYVALKN